MAGQSLSMSKAGSMVDQKLIECIPNFSEGRRGAVIDAIVAAIGAHPVHVLNVHSDADHNRTVVTFAGEPDAVSSAMFAGAQIAIQHIDLRHHDGQHPRIGAVDVVPFVPLRHVSFDEAVALARTFARRVGDELAIPVYLYDAAALRADRRDLAQIRRPQYEGLSARIDSDPHFMPDSGPHTLGPAGAMVVGARGPLIAFNAYLDTDDVETAQTIARAIRASSGGLAKVKALGLFVNGQAQVSMNLTDYRQTGLAAVMDALQHHAALLQTRVTHTEIVGLVPREALLAYAAAQLGLSMNPNELVLEHQLGSATGDFSDITFE